MIIISNINENLSKLSDCVSFHELSARERAKFLFSMKEDDWLTKGETSCFFDITSWAISSVYYQNESEFIEDGVCKMKVTDFTHFASSRYKIKEIFSDYGDARIIFEDGSVKKILHRGTLCFPKRALIRVAMMLYNSPVATEVRNQLLNVSESIPKDNYISEMDCEDKLLEVKKSEEDYRRRNAYVVSGITPEIIIYERYRKRCVLPLEEIKTKSREYMELGFSRKQALLAIIKPLAEACSDKEIDDIVDKAFEDLGNMEKNPEN